VNARVVVIRWRSDAHPIALASPSDRRLIGIGWRPDHHRMIIG
jgi:hypothetical protein